MASLSDKGMWKDLNCNLTVYTQEDVKEFIKDLKKEIKDMVCKAERIDKWDKGYYQGQLSMVETLNETLKELSGDKLT